ncbi:MAG: hypothetical protein DRN95_03635 [Candidatus Hydrothermarchaeota archaeon]|nr:MAG: hypothetical protein DRN95_03635 [Candidatus Hydrothermarchaeota archaeon]
MNATLLDSKILGIIDLDKRNRVSFPPKLFEFLGDTNQIKLVEFGSSISEKTRLIIVDFNEEVEGKMVATLNVNKNERRTVLPKRIRKFLGVDNVNHKYLIIHTEKFGDKEYAILKRLDINKILGD